MLGVAAQVVGVWDESKRTLSLWGGSTTFMAPKAVRLLPSCKFSGISVILSPKYAQIAYRDGNGRTKGQNSGWLTLKSENSKKPQ